MKVRGTTWEGKSNINTLASNISKLSSTKYRSCHVSFSKRIYELCPNATIADDDRILAKCQELIESGSKSIHLFSFVLLMYEERLLVKKAGLKEYNHALEVSLISNPARRSFQIRLGKGQSLSVFNCSSNESMFAEFSDLYTFGREDW